MATAWILIAVLSGAPRASAAGAGVATAEGRLSPAAEAANRSARSGSDENARADGDDLGALLNRSSLGIRARMHTPPTVDITGKASSLDSMLAAAEKSARENPQTASTDFYRHLENLRQLKQQGRLRVDSTLRDNEMGVYRERGRCEGEIGINPLLLAMGSIVPEKLTALTSFHESGHCLDSELPSKGVLDGEIPAFTLQCHLHKLFDPTGELTGVVERGLELEQELLGGRPSPLIAAARRYLRTLNALRATDCKPDKIREFAYEDGYRDGQGLTHLPTPLD